MAGTEIPPTVLAMHGKHITIIHSRKMLASRIGYFPTNMRACVASQSTELKKYKPLVKMCGITSAKDAAMAAESGADLIGMIIWPNAKRSISVNTAREISKVAREYGAEPVGVFVDDDAETILRASDYANLEYIQLHGKTSRAAFPDLVKDNKIIYVLHANQDGALLNTISDEDGSLVDWIMVDSVTGGSGHGFKWSSFKKPEIRSKMGWVVAGGINAGNVCEAVHILQPEGVDVSSGICCSDGIGKDKQKISSFMAALRSLC